MAYHCCNRDGRYVRVALVMAAALLVIAVSTTAARIYEFKRIGASLVIPDTGWTVGVNSSDTLERMRKLGTLLVGKGERFNFMLLYTSSIKFDGIDFLKLDSTERRRLVAEFGFSGATSETVAVNGEPCLAIHGTRDDSSGSRRAAYMVFIRSDAQFFVFMAAGVSAKDNPATNPGIQSILSGIKVPKARPAGAEHTGRPPFRFVTTRPYGWYAVIGLLTIALLLFGRRVRAAIRRSHDRDEQRELAERAERERWRAEAEQKDRET